MHSLVGTQFGAGSVFEALHDACTQNWKERVFGGVDEKSESDVDDSNYDWRNQHGRVQSSTDC